MPYKDPAKRKAHNATQYARRKAAGVNYYVPKPLDGRVDGRGRQRHLHPSVVGLSTFFALRLQAFSGVLQGSVQRVHDESMVCAVMRQPGLVDDRNSEGAMDYEYRR